MFRSARIKLTAWYLLIIMLVSVSFSLVIYRGLIAEFTRLEHLERARMQRRQSALLPLPDPRPAFFDPDVIAETKQRIRIFLVGVNIVILAGSAAAGYFLAGRTLKPIADMVDEQNRFISDASHELRTPLTSLKSEIEVNLRNKKLTLEETKRLLKSNLEDVNNLQALSENLMKLTRWENNNIPMETVSLSSVATAAVRHVAQQAKAKRVSITKTIPSLTVTGNAALLTELLVILLDNAVKYSANGKTITLSVRRTDGKAEIRVQDQGIGIHKEDLPHIFDRFYRADKSRTKTSVAGYGLGLAIAKQIVAQHHGNIRAASTIGKGTLFTIDIPVNR